MTAVFADSFYYFALVDPKDPARERAVERSRTDARRVVTTQWVLTEVGDGLARSAVGRDVFVRLVQDMQSQPDVHIVSYSDELFAAGIDLYARRPDKEWSLTDCVSFVVMEREGITDALTGDRHFEQAGFVALLK
jgi:predicted nucleic acid-binding protein